MDDLIEELNRALRARGWSAQHASRQIGGSPEFVRNLRRGYVSSLAKFRTLCEVLELEFYVGPRREVGAVDERRLEEAIATVERVLASSHFILDPEDKASVVGAVYGFIGEERSPPIIKRSRAHEAASISRQLCPARSTHSAESSGRSSRRCLGVDRPFVVPVRVVRGYRTVRTTGADQVWKPALSAGPVTLIERDLLLKRR